MTTSEWTEAEYAKAFSPNIRRSAWLLVKSVVRHPVLFARTFRRHPDLADRFEEFAPRVSFGRSDHPLDDLGPMEGVFTAIPNLILRTSQSVLEVELIERRDNRFRFRARAFDLFGLIRFDKFYKHVYDVSGKKPSATLHLRIDVLRSDVFRVRLQHDGEFAESMTPMVCSDVTDDNCDVELVEDGDCYRLRTSKLQLVIHKTDFRVELFDAEGRKLTSLGGKTDNHFGIALDSFPIGFVRDRRYPNRYAVNAFDLAHDEAIYGLGEHFGPMNKVGETLRLWVHEGVGNSTGRIYKAVPFYVSTRGYGVFYNHTNPMTFWVGSRETSKVQVAVEDEKLDFYVFAGDIKEVLGHYTALTGRSPVPPTYSFGTWISRMSYRSQQEILDVAARLRAGGFPADVIHMDVSWFAEDWKCDWQFDRSRFPDPESMCRRLHDDGFRFSLWQQPYVLRGTPQWDEARARGFVAETSVPFEFCGQFDAAPIDFTNPDAAAWYKDRLIRPLLEAGVDVIKTDFGEGIQPSMRFREGTGHAIHNVYPLLYNQAAYEVTRDVHGIENAMVWGRSAYAGSQRYPVQWSGDNAATYGSMQASLRGGLSYGLSGFTFWSQDTGGFVGEPTDELMVRWTQLSVFQSHLRYHGCYPFREPWLFSEDAQRIIRDFLELRYRLVPHLVSESIQSAAAGLPLLRPLVVEHQDDRTVHDIDDQFLCGRDILVAPVMREESTRTHYLPEGIWYDFFTHHAESGLRWITQDCSLDRIPVWLRGGAVIPFGPVVQSTSELTAETPLEFVVLLDQEGRASRTFHLDRSRAYAITADTDEGKVSVRLPNDLPVARVRVIGAAGEVASDDVVLERLHTTG